MGIFGFGNRSFKMDVSALFPPLENDRRPASCFSDWRSSTTAWNYDCMVDSVQLLWETSNPNTFFSRYDLAIQQARSVISVDGGGLRGMQARKTLKVLRKHKVVLVNAFLKRCYDAGKFSYKKDELLANIPNMPEESYAYYLQLQQKFTNGL